MGGVQRGVAVQPVVAQERGEQFERRRGLRRVGDGDGPVQPHDGGRVDRLERMVQRRDLRPVGRRERRCLGVQARRSPPGPGTGRAARSGGHGRALLCPRRSRRRPTVSGPGPRAPPGRPSSRSVACRRASVSNSRASRPSVSASSGTSVDEQAGEADRLVAELGAHQLGAVGRRVPLVEDQVHDVQHARQALGQLVVGRDAVGDSGGDDLALGPYEALVHRRLGGQERPCDLGDVEADDRLQRERQPRFEAERRVAAREDQPQPVVAPRHWLRRRRRVRAVVRLRLVGEALVCAARAWSRRTRSMARRLAVTVSHAPGGQGTPRRGQSAAAAAKASCDGVLGESEVAADLAGHRREDGGPLLAVGAFQDGGDVGQAALYCSYGESGRISTEP